MKTVLRALNRLVDDEVIRGYAIGGAIGSAFYIEAAQTEDIDDFVLLPSAESLPVSLTPVYAALVHLGGVVEREYVRLSQRLFARRAR